MSSPIFLLNAMSMVLPGIQEGSMSCADGTYYPLSPLISITPLFPPSTPIPTHPSFAIKSPHGGKSGHFFFYLCSIQKIHNRCAISIISCDLQDCRKDTQPSGFVPGLQISGECLYILNKLFGIKLSPHTWDIYFSKQKGTLGTKQKTIPEGCCRSVCDTYFTAKCLRLLQPPHVSPPAPNLLTSDKTSLHC